MVQIPSAEELQGPPPCQLRLRLPPGVGWQHGEHKVCNCPFESCPAAATTSASSPAPISGIISTYMLQMESQLCFIIPCTIYPLDPLSILSA